MSSRKIILSLVVALIMQISGCSKVINVVDTIQREGVYFVVGSNQPYSGEIVTHYDSGEIESRFSLKQGIRHGLSQHFFEDGRLAAESNYFEGVRNGKSRHYHVNGRLRFEHEHKMGEPVIQEHFHDTGELWYRVTTIAKKTSLHRWFYKNGGHNYAYTTKAGVKSGLYLEYDEYHGGIKRQKCYNEGVESDMSMCEGSWLYNTLMNASKNSIN